MVDKLECSIHPAAFLHMCGGSWAMTANKVNPVKVLHFTGGDVRMALVCSFTKCLHAKLDLNTEQLCLIYKMQAHER